MSLRISGVIVLLMLWLPLTTGCAKVQKALGLSKGTEEEAFDEDADTDVAETDDTEEEDDADDAGEDTGGRADDAVTETKEAKGTSPDKAKLVSVEKAKPVDVRAMARKQRDEMMAQAKKFNRYPITRQLVRKKYDVDLDNVFPEGNYSLKRFPRKSTVDSLIEKEAAAAAEDEFPSSMRGKIVKQAADMHPLYKIGDLVETRVSKRNVLIRGKLEGVYNDFILLGGRRILLSDLRSPNPIHFNPSAIKSRRQLFVRNNYDDPKKRFQERTKREIGPRIYRDHGFVQRKSKWVSLKVLIPKYIEPSVKVEEERYYRLQKREIERQIARDFRKRGLLPSK